MKREPFPCPLLLSAAVFITNNVSFLLCRRYKSTSNCIHPHPLIEPPSDPPGDCYVTPSGKGNGTFQVWVIPPGNNRSPLYFHSDEQCIRTVFFFQKTFFLSFWMFGTFPTFNVLVCRSYIFIFIFVNLHTRARIVRMIAIHFLRDTMLQRHPRRRVFAHP